MGGVPLEVVALTEKLRTASERSRFDSALRGNSAAQRLLSRNANEGDLIKLCGEAFLSAGSGVQHIDLWSMQWIDRGGKGEAHSVDD